MHSLIPLFAVALLSTAPALAADTLPLPRFQTVELRGGGEIVVVPGSAQKVTILEGSRQFTNMRVERGGILTIDSCARHCPANYRIRVQIAGPVVPDLAVTGGGKIKVNRGFRQQTELSTAVTGGGKIDAAAVEVRNVSAAVTGGGQVIVHARANLSAAVRGGGAVNYWGNPSISMAVHGGGVVTPAR